jgi:hypothetical protein
MITESAITAVLAENGWLFGLGRGVGARSYLSTFLLNESQRRPLGSVVTSVGSVSDKATDRFFLVLSQFNGTIGRSSQLLRF